MESVTWCKAMGKLTTHVLDTAHGRPAADVKIALYRLDGEPSLLTEVSTNGDGRCDRPLLEGEAVKAGTYRLIFHAGDYFAGLGIETAEPRFLDQVVIQFGIAQADQHYHVPLLLSPFGYSTYRGS